MTPAPAPKTAPIGIIVLTALAALLYVAMLSGLAPDEGTDAAGRGLAQGFALVFGVGLWIVLAILQMVAAIQGRMPLAATLALVILLPAAAVGTAYAMGLIEHEGAQWLAVPALLPPLFVLYALWARFPALHTRLPAGPTSLVFGAAIAALTVTPIVVKELPARPDPEREARLAAAEKARKEEEEWQSYVREARDSARFQQLGPDSPLGDYVAYLRDAGIRQAEARAGMRQVKSRQTDIVAMLKAMPLHDVPVLTDLDLQPDEALCQAYAGALGKAAAGVSPKARSDYIGAAIELEYELPTIRWLRDNKCDLGVPLGQLEANLRAVADSPRITKFADTIAALR